MGSPPDSTSSTHGYYLRLVLGISRLFSKKGVVILRKGGVLIAVKNNLVSIPRPDLDSDCEIVWCEVLLDKETILLGSYYRQESLGMISLDALDNSLSKVTKLAGNRHVILTWDFNLPSIDWATSSVPPGAKDANLCRRLLDIAHDFNLEQLVHEPTRYGPTSANTLDLVFISQSLTYYLTLKFYLDCSHRTVQQNWQVFKTTILALARKHYPVKLVKPQQKNPWFDRTLRRLTRKKQRLFKLAKKVNTPQAWSAYRKHRKVTTQAINKTRNNYVSGLLDENIHTKPKRFWNYIKSKRQDSVGIPALKVNNVIVSESKAKAEALNNYFKSVFCRDSPDNASPNLPPKDNITPLGNITVTVNGAIKLIDKLKPNKACGPDKVSARILKLAPTEVSVVLREIFQQSLDTGDIPDDWRHAFVTPIHKKDSGLRPKYEVVHVPVLTASSGTPYETTVTENSQTYLTGPAIRLLNKNNNYDTGNPSVYFPLLPVKHSQG
ncbi:uncharacterized protein LOC116615558 [Nematostella vectensis]|uniref:uncharacterized protein LOC116615558 n=1 Tax=Nematostella vectensis TaxID=45351 RepID=UPI0020779057|nr:uncharacterized protein LOC116615558 [Nematostella vectensis]